MKTIKKALSLLFVAAMLLSVLGVSALAAGTNTVTITSETEGHTYQAYQVFAGDQSDENVLSNVTWGSGVTGTALLAALKADATYGTHFTGSTTAAEVAAAIGGISDPDFPNAFAKIVAENLTSNHTNSGAASGTGPYAYTISGLADGYYFINEADLGGGVDNSYTKYILEVVDDVTVAAKTDKPAVAKKIKENNDSSYKDTWNDAADYNIGDAVPFRVVGLVPDMSYYDTYTYEFTDALSAGLTFDADSLKVYYVAGGSDMYTIETSTAEGAGGALLAGGLYDVAATANGFTLSFDDLKTTAGVSGGGYLVVEYAAALNSGAVIGNPGNPNEVYLTYSNNPNGTGTGETPKDEVVAFAFELPVEKIDGTTKNALAGATFALFADQTAANAAAADPDADGAFNNALKFTGSAGNYILDSSGAYTLEGDAEGKYAVKGLDQGTYYLVEIQEPTGYNRLTTATAVTVLPAYDGTKYVDGHVPDATEDQLLSVAINDAADGKLTVENEAGSTLPETGGIGTTIFTVGGFLLMLAAAVLFIVKRKVAAQKD